MVYFKEPRDESEASASPRCGPADPLPGAPRARPPVALRRTGGGAPGATPPLPRRPPQVLGRGVAPVRRVDLAGPIRPLLPRERDGPGWDRDPDRRSGDGPSDP